MDKSTRAYRFAFWGILALVIVHFVYYVLLFMQLPSGMAEYRELYIRALITQFLLISIILMLEVLVYWLIRYRLYKVWWVRMHIILLWVTLFFIPLVFTLIYFFVGDMVVPGQGSELFGAVSIARTVTFWGSIIVGHLFFIATIVKSFFKPKQPPDASDSANILDEFNQ